MTARGLWLVLVFLTATIAGCDRGPESGHGFTLPEGDAAAGEAAFVRLHCNDCHAVAGRDDLRENVDPTMSVGLGGKTTRIQTYGQLVTSVINPSHRISQRYSTEPVAVDGVSRMRNYNDVMTVTEMTDIVTFLQEQYELEPVTPTTYQGYNIP
jgi:cytochrome c2